MKQEDPKLGSTAASDGFQRLMMLAMEICEQEKRRIELENEAATVPLTLRGEMLWKRYVELQAICSKEHTNSWPLPRWITYLYATAVLILFIGAVFITHTTLSYFGVTADWWFIAVVVAIVTSFTGHTILERYESAFLWALCVAGFACGIAATISLNWMRAGLFMLLLQQQLLYETLSSTADTASAFYQSTAYWLAFAFVSLAIATELATSLLLHRLIKSSATTRPAKEGFREMSHVLDELMTVTGGIIAYRNASAIFEAKFKRDFAISLLHGIERHEITRWLTLAVIATTLVICPAFAETHNAVVVLPDLTVSVGTKTYDGESNYQKNIAAVTRLIGILPPETSITVVGITDQSFARPYVLLTGSIPAEAGPLALVDRRQLARKNLIRELTDNSKSLAPHYTSTDIFGAFKYAAEVLNASTASKKVVVVFSDMRNTIGRIDLESPDTIDARALSDVKRFQLMVPMVGVEVFVLGVDGAGKSIRYWNSLRDFWTEYFRRTGALLKAFSPTREIPQLGTAQKK